MKDPLIGLCYFPTTVALVDDEPAFVDSLVMALGTQFPVKTFTKATKALDYFNNQYSRKSFSKELLLPEEEEGDLIKLNFDLRAVDQLIYNDNRFSEITVLVVDQAMPDMTGLELCRQLNRHKMRIILLTGEAGNEMAVAAFNKGIIHQFILKSVPNREQVLKDAIKHQQLQYFIGQANNIFDNAEVQSDIIATQLSDPLLVKYFLDMVKKHNIVEYYLLDNEGGFLLADENGKTSLLALKSADMLDAYYDIAKFGENTPTSVLTALEEHSHVPLFYLGSDLNTPPENWDTYLHPATKVQGEYGTYYCAWLPEGDKYGVKADRICGYRHYLFNPSAL